MDVLGGGGGGLDVLGGGGAALDVVTGAGTDVELTTGADVGAGAAALEVGLTDTDGEAGGADEQAARKTRIATRMPGITSFLLIYPP